MARQGNGLTQRAIEAAKPRATRYRISDRNGLLLEVRPTGSKAWLCRLTVAGRRRDMGLGDYPAISLADARTLSREARRLARSGFDPIAERERTVQIQQAKQAAARSAEARTFRGVAEACVHSLAPGWKHDLTAKHWRASLAIHVYPVIGSLPVAEVDRSAVQRTVSPIWTSRPGMAKKVLNRIGTVLRYAAAHGWRANDNPADRRMLRLAGLPALPAGRSFPSLSWRRLPAFLKALDGMDGIAPLALRFAILTACRTGEVRGARWSEFAFDGHATWTVPAERMKGSRARERDPHRVPLSAAALETLARAYRMVRSVEATPEDLPHLAHSMGHALVFPAVGSERTLSDMALSAVLKRTNAARVEGAPAPWRDPEGREVVPHGFRASFRTWVDDVRPEDAEAAERALAHEEVSKVRAAYRRSDLFDRRIWLMESWGRWCEGASGPR